MASPGLHNQTAACHKRIPIVTWFANSLQTTAVATTGPSLSVGNSLSLRGQRQYRHFPHGLEIAEDSTAYAFNLVLSSNTACHKGIGPLPANVLRGCGSTDITDKQPSRFHRGS